MVSSSQVVPTFVPRAVSRLYISYSLVLPTPASLVGLDSPHSHGLDDRQLATYLVRVLTARNGTRFVAGISHSRSCSTEAVSAHGTIPPQEHNIITDLKNKAPQGSGVKSEDG